MLGLVTAPILLLTYNDWQARLNVLNSASVTLPSTNQTPTGNFDYAGIGTQTISFPPEVVLSPRPEDYLRDTDLPVQWSWREVSIASGISMDFTTRIRNQFLPLWCGSCWAHAATAVLGSRWFIHKRNQNRKVDFSVQYLVNCVTQGGVGWNHGSRGCDGGSSYGSYVHAHKTGLVDSSCLPYIAQTQNCTAQNVCEQNLASPPVPVTPLRHFVSEFGIVGKSTPGSNPGPVSPVPPGNEVAMLKEIYARGPISCCMASRVPGFHNYTGGIFHTTSNRTACDHLVAVVGFGGEGSGAYWQVQNSFGSTWGESGYFRIKRLSALLPGEHNSGMELACSWPMP